LRVVIFNVCSFSCISFFLLFSILTFTFIFRFNFNFNFSNGSLSFISLISSFIMKFECRIRIYQTWAWLASIWISPSSRSGGNGSGFRNCTDWLRFFSILIFFVSTTCWIAKFESAFLRYETHLFIIFSIFF
jgi:hypothetical protein